MIKTYLIKHGIYRALSVHASDDEAVAAAVESYCTLHGLTASQRKTLTEIEPGSELFHNPDCVERRDGELVINQTKLARKQHQQLSASIMAALKQIDQELVEARLNGDDDMVDALEGEKATLSSLGFDAEHLEATLTNIKSRQGGHSNG